MRVVPPVVLPARRPGGLGRRRTEVAPAQQQQRDAARAGHERRGRAAAGRGASLDARRREAPAARVERGEVGQVPLVQGSVLVGTQVAAAEDEERRGQDVIQKLTDDYIAKVETALGEKETDLMAI